MFWDSSAVVPVLVTEIQSAPMAALLRTDPGLRSGGPVQSNGSRRCIDVIGKANSFSALSTRRSSGSRRWWQTPTSSHPRSGCASGPDVCWRRSRFAPSDALWLAAALVWCNEAPQGDSFVSLDDRLREAARREGFAVVPG